LNDSSKCHDVKFENKNGKSKVKQKSPISLIGLRLHRAEINHPCLHTNAGGAHGDAILHNACGQAMY